MDTPTTVNAHGTTPPPEPWAYELDDYGVTYGPGWWPWHRDGKPTSVRVAPNTAYRAWGNLYALIEPGQDARAHAYISLFAGARGTGADVIGNVRILIDLRHGTATVDTELPADYAEPAKALAAKLLAAVRKARAERRRGIRHPTTAHQRHLAAGGTR